MTSRVEEAIIAESGSVSLDGNVLVGMIGVVPKYRPYLAIRLNISTGPNLIATIDRKWSLRALAHCILAAIGEPVV